MTTSSFRIGIGVRLDSDSETDIDPSSKLVRVDSTKSSSESSNTSGGGVGFVFGHTGGLGAGSSGADCYGAEGGVGYWGEEVGCYGGCGGGGAHSGGSRGPLVVEIEGTMSAKARSARILVIAAIRLEILRFA